MVYPLFIDSFILLSSKNARSASEILGDFGEAGPRSEVERAADVQPKKRKTETRREFCLRITPIARMEEKQKS